MSVLVVASSRLIYSPIVLAVTDSANGGFWRTIEIRRCELGRSPTILVGLQKDPSAYQRSHHRFLGTAAISLCGLVTRECTALVVRQSASSSSLMPPVDRHQRRTALKRR
jgi:hypothetical protein